MDTNRDIRRQNKASTVVDATIFSLITDDGVSQISKFASDAIQDNDDSEETSLCQGCISKKRKFQSIKNLASTTSTSNELQRSKYLKCSTYLKTGAFRIAQTENNAIKRAMKCNEQSILSNRTKHVSPCMVKLQSDIVSQIGKLPCAPSINYVANTQNDTTPQSIAQYPSLPYPSLPYPPLLFNQFIPQSIPTLSLLAPFMSIQYLPLQAVQMIINLADGKARLILDLPKCANGKHPVRNTTTSTIIEIMIHNKYVPLKRTAMFRLLKEYKDTNTLRYPTVWFDLSKTGRKAALEEETVDMLIDEYHKKTVGGAAHSKRHLSSNLNALIRKEYEAKTGKQYTSEVIPEATMRKYINKVQSIPEFNVMENVSNKTESRAAAEFSIRSTICYLLVVLCTHFVRAKPTKYHCQQKDLMSNPVYCLVRKLNSETIGINDELDVDNEIVEEFIPVLPRLVTSTDECTIFVSNKTINDKDNWYITSRPKASHLPSIDSSKRDIFCTDMSGDKHHRGVRMTLNNTFTADGRCAPVFACIYGLSAEEMPGNDIVVLPIKGLVAASEQNGSEQNGYVVFIRGKFHTVEEVEEQNNFNMNLPDDLLTPPPKKMSKEARVAKLYRELVYYPFIRDIRLKSGLDPHDNEIPENLRAISWMDGCLGQLHLMSQETVLDAEFLLKITANKQSPARTAVEQAADVGAMFKLIRSLIKSMPNGDVTNSHIYHLLIEEFERLEKQFIHLTNKINKDIVILPSFKKSAIIAGLSKLPEAMGIAFRVSIVKKSIPG